VRIGDDQLHSGPAAGLDQALERGPEPPVLGVADVEPEHLTTPVGGDTGGYYDRLGHHPAVDPGLAQVASRDT
jgi:hypothetical protein